MNRDPHRRVVRLGVLLATMALVVGCAAPAATSTPSSAPSASAAASQAPTTAPSAEAITLTMQDKETGPGEVIATLIKNFETAHPGVTVERTSKAPGDYDNTIQLAATGPNPPDVFEIAFGYKGMGALVAAQAIRPLTEYATQHGWDTRYGPGTLAGWSFTDDGKQWGTGSLYGVALGGEVVGVFYNKDKFEKLGLTVPTTFEEFEANLEKAKVGGERPIQLGNSEKWPGIMQLAPIINSQADVKTIQDWIYNKPGGTFDNPAELKAAQILADWASKGYFGKGYDASTNDDSQAAFGNGDGVFFMNGSWSNSGLAKAMGDNVGFFLLPHAGGGPAPTTSSSGAPFTVSSKSKHPELAAALIDTLTGPEAAKLVAAQGGLPLLAEGVPDKPAAGTSQAAIFDAFAKVWAEDRAVNFLDQSAPIFDPLTAGIQEVMAGKTTPEAFVKAVQQAYADYHATR